MTAVRVGSGGPIVAYGDNGTTVVATKSGGWTTSRVSGQGGYGVSMALDKNDLPSVAYYSSAGEVIVANGIGDGSFRTTTIAHTAGKGGQADPKWSTGTGIDSSGNAFVAFADTKAKDIALSVNAGSTGYCVGAVQNSEGGANPSLAVGQQANQLALAWYDTVNENLNVATTATGPLILAFSPAPALTKVPIATPTGPACSPSGATVQVVAPTGASGAGFEKKCYAAQANTTFTVDFNNRDTAVGHNFEIFDNATDAAAQKGRLGGASSPTDIVTGPGTATYKVNALKPGTYYFQCDVHPTTMNGQFVVAGK